MKLLTSASVLLILLAASSIARADAKFDAAARAKAIAPVVEEGTIGVVHIDLSRMSPQPMLGSLRIVARLIPPLEMWSEQVSGLRRAGVQDIYLIAPGAVFAVEQPQMLMAMPIASVEQQTAVCANLRLGGDETRRIGDLLLIGNRFVLPRKFRPAERPELAAAFEAAGDTAVQVILISPADTQRVVDELWPQLPEQLGGGPSSIFTRGIRWAAAGIDGPPHDAFRLVIQSQDAPAAETLRARLVELLDKAGQQAEVRKRVPEFAAVADFLKPTVEGNRLIVASDKNMETFGKALTALTRPLRVAEARAASTNNLKSIALAMHNYYQAHKHFPLPAGRGPDGKPLLSWRVLLLPFLEEVSLYKQFHLDEPWDSPHNRTLIDKMPAVYRLPISENIFENKEPGRTNYLLPVGNGAGFTADKATEFKDIRDGTSNTIMIVEVDDRHAAIWTKPDDWLFEPKEPAKGLCRFFDGGFNAAFFDGSVRFFSEKIDAKSLRAQFTRAGGEVEPY